MILPPIAACSGISKRWREISSFRRTRSFRPRASALSRWTITESASTRSALTDVHLHQIAGAEADEVVIHCAVPLRGALELVVEVVDHLRKRQLVGEDHAR